MSEVNGQTFSKLKANIRNIALMVLLFIMPLISWYYLSTGLSYQKKARAELKDYGKLPAFNFETQYGTTLSLDNIKGKIAIVHFFSMKDAKMDQTMEKIAKIYDQFKERKDVVFLNFCLDRDIDPKFSLRQYGIDKKLNDKEQFFFLKGDYQAIQNMCTKDFKSPILPKSKPDDPYQFEEKVIPANQSYPFFVLVDTNHSIRNYYSTGEVKHLGRLVEHLAMILPREKKEGTKMIRDREK